MQHPKSPPWWGGRRSAGRTQRGTWHTGNTTLSPPASKKRLSRPSRPLQLECMGRLVLQIAGHYAAYPLPNGVVSLLLRV